MRTLAVTLLSAAALAAPASAATTINGTRATSVSELRSPPRSPTAGAALTNAESLVGETEHQLTSVPLNMPTALSAVSATMGTALTFSAFTGTVALQDFSTLSGDTYLQLRSLGTFTSNGMLSADDGGPAPLAFSQSARVGLAFSGSHILASARASRMPEPGVWTMMITGAGFAGYAVRRRNGKPKAKG